VELAVGQRRAAAQVLPDHRQGPGRTGRAAPSVEHGRGRAQGDLARPRQPGAADGDPAGVPRMTARENQDELEAQFGQWRQYVQRRRELRSSDADELEDHLRGSVDELLAAGLSADEAFLVAVKRMGSLDELSREFAREHSERLWKQLMLTGDTGGAGADTRSRRDLWAMVLCGAGAAVSIKVPELF